MLDKIKSKKAKVCVVGLGYVGVPLAVASAQAGFAVIGVDVEKEKVSMINKGFCYVEDAYSEKHLPELVKAGSISATESLSDGATPSDVVIVCVPTPLDAKGEPDLSFLKSVAKDLSKNLSGFKLVIVESTSFPGTTTEIFQPLLERNGKRPEKDFALVYSPERIDYGNAKFGVRNIPKVVGGINNESTQLGAEFYKAILDARIVTVGSQSVAEAAKMLENIFRYVNIALVNELAVLHETLGVDFVEAINAAATKPFGFMAHYPGPGVGGHCIPKDPFYLVFKAKQAGFALRLVSASKAVNKMMRLHTARFEASTFRKSRALCVTALSYSIQETFEPGESASRLDSPTSQQDAHETKCARGNGGGSTTLASRDAPWNTPLSCRDNFKSGRYSGRIPGFRVQSGLRRHGKKTRYSRTIPGQGKDHLPDSRSGLIMGDFLSERFLPC